MLTFFRRIRKGLLASGATRKYILYAIGEIALVVIGILIALQINNWNEYSRNKLELRDHLNTVLENLNADKFQLENLIHYRDNSVQHSSTMLDNFELKKNSDNRYFIDALLSVTIERRFDRNTSGFDRLEKGELFQSENLVELRNLIVEYDKIIEEIAFWEYRYNTFTEAMEVELYTDGFFKETMTLFRSYFDPSRNSDLLDHYDFHSLAMRYNPINGLFFRCASTSFLVIDMYNQLIAIGLKLSESIELYLLKN